METPLVNRVANSGIITINLEDFYPQEEMVMFDLKDYLFKELILKEKDFRASLKDYPWQDLDGKILLNYCSTDAIIPVWAYMLIASYASPYASDIYQGTTEEYLKNHYKTVLSKLDINSYENQRIVIKGCSNKPVPPSAYADITGKLQPIVRSIMYGEPCSTVPIYKRKAVKD